MVVIRQIQPGEYDKAREIDVSESGSSMYRMVEGQLMEQPLAWQRLQWGEDRYQQLITCWKQAAADGGIVLGAFADDRLVGEAVFRPRLTEWSAQLESLHITKEYRRQGVGRALVNEVIRLARESGHQELYVSATESRSAVSFYRSMGFMPTATPHPRLFALEPADIHMTMPL